MKDGSNQNSIAQSQSDRAPARPRLVVVCGATATGKTSLGITLGRKFSGEVVNADSRYIYRGFDIGVAKPEPWERAGVPHHLIDILPPSGDMSLARYQDLALATIHEIDGRQRLPLLVGGTPLYINALVEGWRIPRVPPNPVRRAELEAEARETGIPALAARLQSVDPASAARCSANLRRIVRALEVFEATGIPMSAQEGKGPPPFTTLELGLHVPREILYRIVDNRVSEQIARGLVEELRALLAGGVAEDAPAMSSLGYRQLLPYLRGECTLERAVEQIRLDTHRYVRHQETWLRRNPRIIWIDASRPSWQEEAFMHVGAFLGQP